MLHIWGQRVSVDDESYIKALFAAINGSADLSDTGIQDLCIVFAKHLWSYQSSSTEFAC